MSSYFFYLYFTNFLCFILGKGHSTIVHLTMFCKNLLPVRTSMQTSEIENKAGR